MIKMAFFAMLVPLIIIVPVAVFGQSSQPGVTIGSETVVMNVDSSQPGFQNRPVNLTTESEGNITSSRGAFFFEARIAANDSAFMVSAVIVEANETNIADRGEPMHNVTGVLVYPSPHSEPIAYSNHADLRWSSGDRGRWMVNTEPFPVSIPKGGILGIRFGTFGLSDGDQIKVTFVYWTNAASTITTSTIPVVNIKLNPLDVVSVSTVQAGDASFAIDNSFNNPEIHCELCTKVEFEPRTFEKAEAAYVAKEMHMTGVEHLEFWTRGQEGGETLTFKAAGKQIQNGTIVYANSTQLTLDTEWKRHEIDLPDQFPPDAASLSGITHLFAFETSGNNTQTFYLKGITYR